MRARWGALLLVLVLMLASAPARAGGWDALIIRGAHIVGDVVSIRSRFFAGELDESGPLDGRPYYAYLLAGSRDESFVMIDAPTIPKGAIRLGEVSVTGPVIAEDGYPYGVAQLTFPVPDVPSGTYAIGFCDDPCTYSTIGWLAWGRIRIVHTPFEGLLLQRLDRASKRMSRIEFERRRAAERAGAELGELKTLPRLSRPLMPEPAFPPTIRVVESPGASVTWWIAAIAALVGVGLGVALARLRAGPGIVVPDTVPDDLDQRILR